MCIYTEWSKSDREGHYTRYCLHVESKKNGTNELIYKTEIVTDVENNLMVTGGKGEKG